MMSPAAGESGAKRDALSLDRPRVATLDEGAAQPRACRPPIAIDDDDLVDIRPQSRKNEWQVLRLVECRDDDTHGGMTRSASSAVRQLLRLDLAEVSLVEIRLRSHSEMSISGCSSGGPESSSGAPWS